MSDAIWQICGVDRHIIRNPAITEANSAEEVARLTTIQVHEIRLMMPDAPTRQKRYRLKTVKKFRAAFGDATTNRIASIPPF